MDPNEWVDPNAGMPRSWWYPEENRDDNTDPNRRSFDLNMPPAENRNDDMDQNRRMSFDLNFPPGDDQNSDTDQSRRMSLDLNIPLNEDGEMDRNQDYEMDPRDDITLRQPRGHEQRGTTWRLPIFIEDGNEGDFVGGHMASGGQGRAIFIDDESLRSNEGTRPEENSLVGGRPLPVAMVEDGVERLYLGPRSTVTGVATQLPEEGGGQRGHQQAAAQAGGEPSEPPDGHSDMDDGDESADEEDDEMDADSADDEAEFIESDDEHEHEHEHESENEILDFPENNNNVVEEEQGRPPAEKPTYSLNYVPRARTRRIPLPQQTMNELVGAIARLPFTPQPHAPRNYHTHKEVLGEIEAIKLEKARKEAKRAASEKRDGKRKEKVGFEGSEEEYEEEEEDPSLSDYQRDTAERFREPIVAGSSFPPPRFKPLTHEQRMRAIVKYSNNLYGPLSPKKKKRKRKGKAKSPPFQPPTVFQRRDLSQALWNINVQDLLPLEPKRITTYVDGQMQGDPSDPDVLRVYDEHFRPRPGDVLLYCEKTKLPLSEMFSYVAIFNDPLFFWKDDGYKEQNILEHHGLARGDLLVRFGKFSSGRTWEVNQKITFFIYWPDLKPPEDSGLSVMHPWYKLGAEILQRDGKGISVPPWPTGLRSPYAPVPLTVRDFRMRMGDLVIRFAKARSMKLPPFHFDINAFYWTPAHEGVGEERLIVNGDRVLRFGMKFGILKVHEGNRRSHHSTAYLGAELYMFRDKVWRYLGQHQIKVNDRDELKSIVELKDIPKEGDIVIQRLGDGIWGRAWNPERRVGGMVSFHQHEDAFGFGERYIKNSVDNYKEAAKHGLGEFTSVLRFGMFINREDQSKYWKDSDKLTLFVLNAQTSGWRKAAQVAWPVEESDSDEPRNPPDYDWTQYNPDDVGEVHPTFRPSEGDILLTFFRDEQKIKKFQDPRFVGNTHNPHWDVTPMLKILTSSDYHRDIAVGDYLIRAGYEKNSENPSWTNATVEIYHLEARSEEGRTWCWRFKGRDMYIFGTNYARGGLAGVSTSGIDGIGVADIQPMLDNQDRPTLGQPRLSRWRS